MAHLNKALDVSFAFTSMIRRPGARFSKVPIINGPVKVLLFSYKMAVSTVLHLT